MIIREFKCNDCETLFESSDADPVCPTCTAEEPERVFLTPPAIRSGDTGRKDKIVKELAADYGMTNLTNKDGQPVKRPSVTEGPTAPQFAPTTNPIMGQLARLGGGSDNFSGLLPAIRDAGRPHQWAKRKA